MGLNSRGWRELWTPPPPHSAAAQDLAAIHFIDHEPSLGFFVPVPGLAVWLPSFHHKAGSCGSLELPTWPYPSPGPSRFPGLLSFPLPTAFLSLTKCNSWILHFADGRVFCLPHFSCLCPTAWCFSRSSCQPLICLPLLSASAVGPPSVSPPSPFVLPAQPLESLKETANLHHPTKFIKLLSGSPTL